MAPVTAGFIGYTNLTVQTSTGPAAAFCKVVNAATFSTCQLGTGTMATGNFVSDSAPDVFDVYTIIPGGKTAVQPSSLTIVNDVPAADRGMPSTVTATANNGLISYVQSAAPTGTFSLTFGYCNTGTATYSASNPACATGLISYGPGLSSDMGAKISVSIVTKNQYQTVHTSVSGPSSVPAGSTFTAYSAAGAAAIPKLQDSGVGIVGDITVGSAQLFTAIVPIPAGMTYVSSKLIGGDALTSGVATVTYCTVSGTGCTAQTTGNYTATTYPYVEVQLPAGIKVNGGGTVTMPTIALTLKATGTPGTVASFALTEFTTLLGITAAIIGTNSINFDGYPTTGSDTSVTPPKAPPTVLSTVTIS